MTTNLTSGNDSYSADGGEIVNALEGDDHILIVHVDDSSGLGGLDFDYFAPAQVYGNQGNDYIASFEWGDMLYGDSGNDVLVGGGGDDMLKGGSGNDIIYTGASFDDEDIGNGDTVWAGTGDDTVYLQAAHHGDTLRGEDGFDTLKLFNDQNHISQFSLLAGGSNAGLYASGFEVLYYYGGTVAEVVEGGTNADTILGGGGGDILSGLGGNDTMFGGDGADIMTGGDGGDTLHGGNDGDVLSGLNGNDFLNGDGGNDSIRDGAGDDHVSGGDGNDTLRTGAGSDSVSGGGGDDTIREEGMDAGAFVFNGQFIAWTGGDKLSGGAGKDDIQGGTGHDTIDGGADDDVVNGGSGADELTGGDGRDVFDFDSLADSGQGEARDAIADFTPRNGMPYVAYLDRIDLSTIDARPDVAGNQAFSFIGNSGFSAAGQVRVIQQGGNAVVQVNTEGNGGTEMAILLLGADASTVTAQDFIL